ncbi:MAG: hypothetical protein IID40_10565 [Planctomycetes bacterium]|nr:hypothetical protein [Planctomycetota bacterium]
MNGYANSSIGVGGGIAIAGPGSAPTLTNCSFTGNSAAFGGGVGNVTATPTLTNCILWGDSASNGREIAAIAGSTVTISYSDVEGRQAGVYLFGGSTLNWGTGNIEIDPLLTPDGHLKTGSPCIDAGSNSAVPPDTADLDGDLDTTEPTPFDIDQDPRFIDDPQQDTGEGSPPIVDMGADEFLDTDADGLPDWWEMLYPAAADPGGDSDSDGLSNLKEYEQYSSNPIAPPYYVDGINGNDAFDGLAATPQGGGVGPKQTIQAAMDVADDGDTVLVAAGTYAGPGNAELDYHAKSIVVRAPGGPALTTIDAGGTGRAVSPGSIQGNFAVLEGFTITGGQADLGGGLQVGLSRFLLKNCELVGNTATTEGGGLHTELATPTIDGLTIGANTAPPGTADAGVIADSSVNLQGALSITAGILESYSSWFWGPGYIDLGPGTLLWVTGDAPTRIHSNITGTGDIFIGLGRQLHIERGAVVDLSGTEPTGDCSAGCPNQDPASWGTIFVDGVLLVRNATIRNTNLEVSLAQIEAGTDIINNDIRLLESSTGFGGEFFVAGTTTVQCNNIVSEGDRYLDLDPDPTTARPTICNNTITVRIGQGVNVDRGELLELRSEDFDTGGPINPAGEAGAYPVLSDSQGFTANPEENNNWALEKLEILPGAKLNLTDRQGFEFHGQAKLATMADLEVLLGLSCQAAFVRLLKIGLVPFRKIAGQELVGAQRELGDREFLPLDLQS